MTCDTSLGTCRAGVVSDAGPGADGAAPWPGIDDNSPLDPAVAACSDCGGTSSQFGTPVGCYRGVIIYSNGDTYSIHGAGDAHASGGDNDSLQFAASSIDPVTRAPCGSNRGLRTPYGLAYQCVEYVRRFYARVHPETALPCCGNATSYWSSQCSGLDAFGARTNGTSTTPPQPDDIVVWSGDVGHIAIVRSVTADAVFVANQNLNDDATNASLRLPLAMDGSGRYRLTSPRPVSALSIRGWLHPRAAAWSTCSVALPCPDGYVCMGGTCVAGGGADNLCAPTSTRTCTGGCGGGRQSCAWTCTCGACDAPAGECVAGMTGACTTPDGRAGTRLCSTGCSWGACAASCVPTCAGRSCGPDPACGQSCGTCSTGACDASGRCVQSCAGVTCSGHGTCAGGACTCAPRYAGPSCDRCAPGYTGYPTCSMDCGARTDCGGRCVDTASDAANCGACGRACVTGQVCSAGRCMISCSTGLFPCGDGCIDPSGTCSTGNPCETGRPACSSGTPRCAASGARPAGAPCTGGLQRFGHLRLLRGGRRVRHG